VVALGERTTMVVVVLVFDVRGKRIDGFSQRYTASKAMNTNWGLLERRR